MLSQSQWSIVLCRAGDEGWVPEYVLLAIDGTWIQARTDLMTHMQMLKIYSLLHDPIFDTFNAQSLYI